ncbi:MAG: hypothetical protein WCG87_07665 [Bacteroidota bacterium]
MKRLVVLFILLFTTHISFSQIHIDPSVDTLETDVKAAIRFYRSYIKAFKDTSLPNFRKYWPDDDCNAYKFPDQIIYGISSDYPTYRMAKGTIMYVKPGKEYVQIKTHFGFADSAGYTNTIAITNHFLKLDNNGSFKFINPLKFTTKGWHTTTVRNVSFCYPPYHIFSKKKADSLIQRIIALEKAWNLEPIKIRYYFANTKEEMQKIRGFDFTPDMGNRDKPSGISDSKDNIIYCAGWGENYFHEVVHIYLNRHYPNSPLKEGLAVFYGGSMGHSLGWHLQRLNNFLNEHTDIDIIDPAALGYMDNYTNPRSAILGLICQLAYDKDGMAGLKNIMSYDNIEDIMHYEFNISAQKCDGFLRRIIANEYGRSSKTFL